MVKAKDISENVIMKTHCDYIINKMNEMKAYLDLSENAMNLESNINRELSAITNCEDSLRELVGFLKDRQNDNL